MDEEKLDEVSPLNSDSDVLQPKIHADEEKLDERDQTGANDVRTDAVGALMFVRGECNAEYV